MTQISQGAHVYLFPEPGQVYRVQADDVATVQVLYGAPSAVITLTAQSRTFGPYDSPAKLKVTANTAPAEYTLIRAHYVELTPEQIEGGAVGVLGSNNAGGVVEPDGDVPTLGGSVTLPAMQTAFDAGTAPQKAAFQSSVSGVIRQYVPAANRMQFQRRVSNQLANGNLMSVRWHRSPPVAIDGLVAVWYAGYPGQFTGLTPLGNNLSVAAAVQYPTGTAPGAAKAFKVNGLANITVPDGGFVFSDLLSIYIPANTSWRLRSYVAPANGYIPLGTPTMGAGNGGSLSGFGTVNDESQYAVGLADSTQLATAITVANTHDTSYAPIILARTSEYLQSWALIGDSRTFGSVEVGSSGGTTAAGAGDAYGNAGIWARACGINGHAYLNFGIPAAYLNTYAVDGFQSFVFELASVSCRHAVISLGTNDLADYTGAQIVANLQKMVNKCRALGFAKILLATLAPRTTSTNGWATLAGQTIDPVRTPRTDVANAAIRSGAITGATVFDLGALLQDPSDPQKWRCDLGFVSSPDGIHESMQMIQWLAPQVAAAMA